MNGARIDVTRLIRIATLLFAMVAAALVYVAYQPQFESLQRRIDDDESELRSDEIAFNEAPVLRAERRRLHDRYAPLFAQNPEAVFVRELARAVRRHGVTLVSTSVTSDQSSSTTPSVPPATTSAPPATTSVPSSTPSVPWSAAAPNAAALFSKTHVSIELRGAYRTLLATIADLSSGSEIVEVQPPTLARDGDGLSATVPLNIYEPRLPLVQAAARLP